MVFAADLVLPLVLLAAVVIFGGFFIIGMLRSPFIPTRAATAVRLLALLQLQPDETFYDLGCGDGRLLILAAQKYGVHAVGYELSWLLVLLARLRARLAGVAAQVKIVRGDLFAADLRAADAVSVYLLPRFLKQLTPKLVAELRPGVSVVSLSFQIPGWQPVKVAKARGAMGQSRLLLYRV